MQSSELTVAYWNALYKADPDKQKAYLDQFAPAMDIFCVAECTDALASRIKDSYANVAYEPGITAGSKREGLCVVTKQPTPVNFFQEWPTLRYRTMGLTRIIDGRKFAITEQYHETIGKIAIALVHVTHPQAIWAPSTELRRILEWYATSKVLEVQEMPWLVMGDTNTIRDSVMHARLRFNEIDGEVVPRSGGSTWGIRTKRWFSIDKVGARSDLAQHTTATTLPTIMHGVKNPSDHSPIVATIHLDEA